MAATSKKQTKNRSKFTPISNWRSPLRIVNFVLLFSFIGILFLYFSKAAQAPGWYGSVEQDQVNRINSQRASVGRSQLKHIECLNTIAENWTLNMVKAGTISHNPNTGPQVASQCGSDWAWAGENVGVTYYGSADVWAAFMKSPGHRANIESSNATRVGLGVYWSTDGRMFVTQVFANCKTCGGNWNTSATLPADPATVVGSVDTANCRKIAGWSFDRDSSSLSNRVHIYIDGTGYDIGTTPLYRGDVNKNYGISGNHGFDWTVPDKYRDGKTHIAEIYGLSTSGGSNALIGQRTLDACANPVGHVDGANCSAISGWAFDMNDVARSIDVHVYIDGVGYVTGPTPILRSDVNSVYAAYGVIGKHGFSYAPPSRWKDGRQHKADIYGINIGAGGNKLLGSAYFGPCK